MSEFVEGLSKLAVVYAFLGVFWFQVPKLAERNKAAWRELGRDVVTPDWVVSLLRVAIVLFALLFTIGLLASHIY